MLDGVEYPKTEHGSHGDALQEHLELSHYISVFSASAGRVRYVMFIIMVLSVTIVIAQWNTTSPSWAKRRYQRLSETLANPTTPHNTQLAERFATAEELAETVADYRRQRVEHVYLTEIPGLGITFDVNDLGLFSGVAYVLLLLLLVFCLMREHENLCLALFKVTRLHDRDLKRPDGESTANFLYHALAMGTVFTTPPSLARWRPAAPQRIFLNFVFFVPALVQAYIVVTNYQTRDVAVAYGAPAAVMSQQYVLFGLVLALGIWALIYAGAANRRWNGAFFHINPGLRRIQQQPWLMWVKRSRHEANNPFQRKLWAQAVQQLVVDNDVSSNGSFAISHALPVGAEITYADVMQMCRESEGRAVETAKTMCVDRPEFVRADVVSSIVSGADWVLETRWFIRCTGRAPEHVTEASDVPATVLSPG